MSAFTETGLTIGPMEVRCVAELPHLSTLTVETDTHHIQISVLDEGQLFIKYMDKRSADVRTLFP